MKEEVKEKEENKEVKDKGEEENEEKGAPHLHHVPGQIEMTRKPSNTILLKVT